ncbi:MAG: hypothetical protein HVN35_00710 [Methanobacteriaceae archaeon]|nr:hypothetical protein [Methanobacteriaceae archaeon]
MSAFSKGTKNWDKYLILSYTILGLYGQFFVAGLDIGRVKYHLLSLEYLLVVLLLYLVSIVLVVWAMIQNPFFKPSVRIQEDRGQKVITSGP